MQRVVISGTGLFTPSESISNDELVAAFNAYVQQYNLTHAQAIAEGSLKPLAESSSEFINKASGIKSRYVMNKSGVIDPSRMFPHIPERADDELGIQAEIAVISAREALAQAGKTPADVDAIIVACSNMQRAYPAVAIEVQQALGCGGFAYDMNVACSSAILRVQEPVDASGSGTARCGLVISPGIPSAHL